MSNADLLAAAKQYAALGWSIIPIRNNVTTGRKQAACPWTPFQTTPPTMAELDALFRRPRLTGLAVVLGPVSHDLYARDFDTADAYDAWAHTYPDWAGRLPTVQTARGCHVYGRFPGVRTIVFPDGELRGAQHYTVLPPSHHLTGCVYTWRGPALTTRDAVPLVDPAAIGLAFHLAQDIPPTQGTQGTQGTQVVGDRGGRLPAPLSLEAAIAHAQPTAPGENHAKLFYLARWVRAVELYEGRTMFADEKRRVFDLWYAANRFLRPEQSRDEYLLEFAAAYQDVQHPLGAGPLDLAWRAAMDSPRPHCTTQFTDERVIQVVAWCRELQRLAGEQPFFLAARSIRDRLGLPTHEPGARMLRGLVALGILDEIEKGSRNTRRASLYRYRPPMDE